MLCCMSEVDQLHTFCHNSYVQGISQNHCTNTRLVCIRKYINAKTKHEILWNFLKKIWKKRGPVATACNLNTLCCQQVDGLHFEYWLVAILLYKGWKFRHFFLVALVILWTSEPILGLFVLGWIHFSCWVQIWQWEFDFPKLWKKIDNFGLPSVLDAGMGKVKVDWCIMWEFDLSLNLTLCIVCWNLSRWTQKWFYFRFPVLMRCGMLDDDVGE